MTRTQIQLPDDLYKKAKRFAETREMSLAEVVRRGLEQLFASYPPPEHVEAKWQMPTPRKLGCRPLTAAELRDAARVEDDAPTWLAAKSRGA